MRDISTRRARTLPSNSPSEGSSSVSYEFLSASWRKGLRNGSWASISLTQRALYRCALWVAKARGSIVNKTLVEQILQILHFLESIRSRILAAGNKRARDILKNHGNRGGIFDWAPPVKEWLQDATYIFYLGVNSQP